MITQEVLKELLYYDNTTGVFTWLKNRNKNLSGKPAGWKSKFGYIHIEIFGKQYKAHRLAWFYTYGTWPTDQLDHINRNREDNRIVNLRECDHSKNGQNRNLQKNSTTGYRGVSYHNNTKKWSARIGINNKRINLGYFDTPQDASQAYINAKNQIHTFNPTL